MKLFFRLLLVVAVFLSIPSGVDAQSAQVMLRGAYIGSDPERNVSFRVFESVTNTDFMTDKQYSRLQFYVAPFFAMVPYSDTVPFRRIELGETVRYVLKIEHYSDKVDQLAVDRVSDTFSSSTNNFRFSINQFQHMDHGQVTVQFNYPPNLAAVLPNKASFKVPVDGAVIQLNPTEELTIDVPTVVDKEFQALLNSETGFIQFAVEYNLISLNQVQLTWSLSDVTQTSAYQQLDSGGANFVTTRQVQTMLRESATKRNFYVYADPAIDDKIVERAQKIMDDLLLAAQDIQLESISQANELDALLRQGTGLTAAEFKPITLLWEVHETLKTVDDHETANETMEAKFKAEEEAFASTFNLHTKTKAKGGGNFGVIDFSASGSVETNLNLDYSNFRQRVENKAYFNEESYKAYKASTRDASGQEVFIVPRGLDLVERSTFEQRFEQTARYIYAQPVSSSSGFVSSLSGYSLDANRTVASVTGPVGPQGPAGPVGPQGPPMTNAFEIRLGNDVTVSSDERNGRSTARCSSGYTAIAVACEVADAETFLVTQKGSFLQGDRALCHFQFQGDSDLSKDGRARVACMRSDLLFP